MSKKRRPPQPQAIDNHPWKRKIALLWLGCFTCVVLPGLGVFALFLAAGSLPFFSLTDLPQFVSLSLLKTNFICSAPLFFLLAWMGMKKLYFPHATLRYEARATTTILAFTLSLIMLGNAIILTLHFTVFSLPRYVRCWEPFPLAWHYAVTPDVCIKQGYAPVEMLRRH